MTPERMQQLIAAYGADPARWPPDERIDPAELPGALRREVAEFDADLLNALPDPPLPAGLRARILAAAPAVADARAPAPPPSRSGWRELWQALGGLRLAGPAFACALSLGVGLAWLMPSTSDTAYADQALEDYLALAWIDPIDSEDLP